MPWLNGKQEKERLLRKKKKKRNQISWTETPRRKTWLGATANAVWRTRRKYNAQTIQPCLLSCQGGRECWKKTKISCINQSHQDGSRVPRCCAFLSNSALPRSVYYRNPLSSALWYGGEKKNGEVEFWQNLGVSSPSKQSNSPLLFSKCGLLPLSTACQGCCGGRKEGEGFPLCMCVCVCVFVRIRVHVCVYMRVFVCQERGKKGRSAAYGCIFACLFHYASRISGCLCIRACAGIGVCACTRVQWKLGEVAAWQSAFDRGRQNGSQISRRGNWALLTLSFAVPGAAITARVFVTVCVYTCSVFVCMHVCVCVLYVLTDASN